MILNFQIPHATPASVHVRTHPSVCPSLHASTNIHALQPSIVRRLIQRFDLHLVWCLLFRGSQSPCCLLLASAIPGLSEYSLVLGVLCCRRCATTGTDAGPVSVFFYRRKQTARGQRGARFGKLSEATQALRVKVKKR